MDSHAEPDPYLPHPTLCDTESTPVYYENGDVKGDFTAMFQILKPLFDNGPLTSCLGALSLSSFANIVL